MEPQEKYLVDMQLKQRQVYDHRGFDTQLDKLEEECLELALAIKHRNKPGSDGARNIIEEMADVLNLIEQIKDNNSNINLGVDKWKEFKVNRELDRIKGDESVGKENLTKCSR